MAQAVTVANVSDQLVVDKQPSLGRRWKELARYFLKHPVKTTVWQRRPNTVVIAEFVAPDGTHHTNFGESKVCHPDEWDPNKGEKIAYLKAATNAAKDHIFGSAKVTKTNDSHRGVKDVAFSRLFEWSK